MIAMAQVAELMHHHVVNHGEWSHQALPVKLQIPIGHARCPAVGQILDLYFAGRNTYAAGKVGDACGDTGQSLGAEKILKCLLRALTSGGFND